MRVSVDNDYVVSLVKTAKIKQYFIMTNYRQGETDYIDDDTRCPVSASLFASTSATQATTAYDRVGSYGVNDGELLLSKSLTIQRTSQDAFFPAPGTMYFSQPHARASASIERLSILNRFAPFFIAGNQKLKVPFDSTTDASYSQEVTDTAEWSVYKRSILGTFNIESPEDSDGTSRPSDDINLANEIQPTAFECNGTFITPSVSMDFPYLAEGQVIETYIITSEITDAELELLESVLTLPTNTEFLTVDEYNALESLNQSVRSLCASKGTLISAPSEGADSFYTPPAIGATIYGYARIVHAKEVTAEFGSSVDITSGFGTRQDEDWVQVVEIERSTQYIDKAIAGSATMRAYIENQ